MSLVKRNHIMFPSLMDELFKPDWFGGLETKNSIVPPANIVENEASYEIALATPGYRQEDLNIEINANVLHISSEIVDNEKEVKMKYSRKEFSKTAFKRAFTLPKSIDSDKIEAFYQDGILTLTLPKREEALPKPKRTIAISS